MTYFHPEEEFQFESSRNAVTTTIPAPAMLSSSDGESYVCRYSRHMKARNSGELDIEIDDRRYDEFYQIAMNIVETI